LIMSKGDWKMGLWMDRDLEAARLFNACSNVSHSDAKAFSGISDNRLYT